MSLQSRTVSTWDRSAAVGKTKVDDVSLAK